MTPLSFVVFGNVQPKGSSRAFVRGGRAVVVSDNPNLKKWESAVRFAAETIVEKMGHRLFEGAVRLDVTFHIPRPKSIPPRLRQFPTVKPDLSKLVRGLEDALSSIVWRDDAQVVGIATTKRYTDGPAHAQVTVSPVLTTEDLPKTKGPV